MELPEEFRQSAGDVRRFLWWAWEIEQEGKRSLRYAKRPDVAEAKCALSYFEDPLWGIVMFSTCDHLEGAREIARWMPRPSDLEAAINQVAAERILVGRHRIRPGKAGAMKAIASAAGHWNGFESVVGNGKLDFDTRYRMIRRLHADQWGRTTVFDLLARAGWLGLGGHRYVPEYLYLAGSTGPRKAISKIFPKRRERVINGLVTFWIQHWDEVAEAVGVTWKIGPYTVADLENALCLYQHEAR